MKQYTHSEVLSRLARKLATGKAIVAAGAGSGISAKFEEQGGADLLLVFASGRFRMHGLGSLSGLLAYGDANAIAIDMGERQILPAVKEVPVICSVNGTDPTRVMRNFLKKVVETGFSGVNNFPTVGLIDGKFREAIEHTGMSYDKEVEMIATAHEMDLFTMAYAFTPAEARKMAEAGCDMLLVHLGLTSGGSVGAKETMTLDRGIELTGEMLSVAREVNPNVYVLVHGGPVSSADDVRAVLRKVPIQGFVGASSMERLPVEESIRKATASFTSLTLDGR